MEKILHLTPFEQVRGSSPLGSTIHQTAPLGNYLEGFFAD